MSEQVFGIASEKKEGDLISPDGVPHNDGWISDSRWIEVCHSELNFKKTGIGQETIEVMCAEIDSRFGHLNKDQRYASVVALINRLIPESGF